MSHQQKLTRAYDLKEGDLFAFTRGGLLYRFDRFSADFKASKRASYTEVLTGAGCFDTWIFNKKVFLDTLTED